MSRSQIRGGQIKDDSITGDDVDESTLVLNTLRDGDGDTKVQVEESADEDKIRFDTAGVERMSIDSAGTAVSGSLAIVTTDPTILFQEGSTNKASIGINSSDNILFENFTMNKHIVFKVNDQGVVKEGFRLDGAVPEVVVNQTSDSLVDFRVESDNQTHMVFVDGSQDRVGIGTDSPDCTLEVVNNDPSISTLQITTTEDGGAASPILELKRNSASPAAGDYIGQLKFQGENDADQQVTYAKMTAKITDPQDTTEDALLEFALRKNGSNSIAVQLTGDVVKTKNGCGLEVDGNAAIKGGIKKSSIRDVNSSTTATDTDYILRCIHNSPITITLPSKGNNAGQELIIKDALGNAGAHTITIDGAGSDTIDGAPNQTLSGNFKCLTLVCDGINGWMIVGSYEG